MKFVVLKSRLSNVLLGISKLKMLLMGHKTFLKLTIHHNFFTIF